MGHVHGRRVADWADGAHTGQTSGGLGGRGVD